MLPTSRKRQPVYRWITIITGMAYWQWIPVVITWFLRDAAEKDIEGEYDNFILVC